MKNGKSILRQSSARITLLPFKLALIAPVIGLVITLFLVANPAPDLAFDHSPEKDRNKIPGSLKAMDLWSSMRTYPNKDMDARVFSRSYDQARMMDIRHQNPNARITTDPWSNLGPFNFAGRVLSIAFHPTDPDIMWVGSASGGLWKTTNGGHGAANGINWTHVATGFPVLGVSSIVVNPSNPDEIYIGTGEVYNSNAAATGSTGAGHIRLFRGSYGIGILKTTDGGVTWTKTLDFSNSSIKGVMDMLVHPTIPSTVFAATTDGVYRTTNSGGDWDLIHTVPMAMDMVFKPGNPNVIYVGSGNFQSANNGIYKTTNANAGTPIFNKLNSGAFPSPISGKIMLAISADNTSRVYASIGKNPDMGSHTQGLYISDNEGSTWVKCNGTSANSVLGNQGWYGHDIAVSQTNYELLVWGELDTWRSTNGDDFTKRGFWNRWDVNNTTVGTLQEGIDDNYVHADVHRIAPSPHDAGGQTFFALTDGGVFRSTDGGSNWETLNGGLNTIQIYGNMAQHPTDPDFVVLGLQDNEGMEYAGNPGCERIGGLGDGFHAAMNSTGSIRIVESYYFNYKRWTGSWGSSSGQVTTEAACFNVPITWSRTPNSEYVFAGTNRFKRSENYASMGSFVNLNSNTPIAGSNNPCIAMLAPSDNTVYFSTAPGSGVRSKLWRTTNANASAASVSFTEITGSLPDRYYSDIDVDPTNSSRLFVTLSGFTSSHVYMSMDGGSSWTDIAGNLPDVPHNAVFVNPNNPEQIYVGNDIGVFYANGVPTTGALGATLPVTWTAYNEGMDDAMMVSDITMNSVDMLRIGTYGRGLWERAEAPYTNLPVTFLDFQVKATGQGNLCKWVVTDEVDLARYEIQYSRNGINFTTVASLPPQLVPGDITYEYLHRIHNDVDGYYRIRSVDLDGSSDYSPIRMVKADRKVRSMVAYPNPTSGIFQLKVPTTQASLARIQVFAIDGRLVEDRKLALQAGINIVPMNISTHANGTYRVVCTTIETTWKLNIIKK